MDKILLREGVSDTAVLAILKSGLDNMPPNAVTATQVYKATLKGGKPSIFQLVSG